jgi:Ni,Fe-hydrogenase III large subunit
VHETARRCELHAAIAPTLRLAAPVHRKTGIAAPTRIDRGRARAGPLLRQFVSSDRRLGLARLLVRLGRYAEARAALLPFARHE